MDYEEKKLKAIEIWNVVENNIYAFIALSKLMNMEDEYIEQCLCEMINTGFKKWEAGEKEP